jgi:hypothetical protein
LELLLEHSLCPPSLPLKSNLFAVYPSSLFCDCNLLVRGCGPASFVLSHKTIKTKNLISIEFVEHFHFAFCRLKKPDRRPMYHHYLLFVICSFVFCVVLTFTRFVKAYGHRWYDVLLGMVPTAVNLFLPKLFPLLQYVAVVPNMDCNKKDIVQ